MQLTLRGRSNTGIWGSLTDARCHSERATAVLLPYYVRGHRRAHTKIKST